jgi:hypothetical protein
MKWRRIFIPLCLLLISTACLTVRRSDWSSDWDFHIGYTTGGGLWLLANFAYGGMRGVPTMSEVRPGAQMRGCADRAGGEQPGGRGG